MASSLTTEIKKALLDKGYRVTHVWFIGLVGWYCELETGYDESDLEEYYLGSNHTIALNKIEENAFIEE